MPSKPAFIAFVRDKMAAHLRSIVDLYEPPRVFVRSSATAAGVEIEALVVARVVTAPATWHTHDATEAAARLIEVVAEILTPTLDIGLCVVTLARSQVEADALEAAFLLGGSAAAEVYERVLAEAAGELGPPGT